MKIGGCEAIRDLLEAPADGVRYIVAPMVESGYALSKYIAAKNRVFPAEEEDTSFFSTSKHAWLLNIEKNLCQSLPARKG